MAHFLQTKSEPHLYYKPWETSPDEEDRIRDQIAEAEETVKREIEEYEARQQPDNLRRRRASEETKGDAEGAETGKNHDAHAPRETTTTNGETNGSAISPKDLDMKDHQPDTPDTNAKVERATEDIQNSHGATHETVADTTMKEDDDENGEDVVEEAAEDTVIY